MKNTKRINLYGRLAEICGCEHVDLVGNDIRIIVSGLISRFGIDVKHYFRENNFIIDARNSQNGHSRNIVKEEIDISLGNTDIIDIFPVIEGAGGKAGRIIAGIVLIVVGVMFAGSSPLIGKVLVHTGIGLVIGTLLSPGAPNAREAPDERASFLFNGPVNGSQQGQPVPIVYGRFKTGSIIVSAGIDVEEISSYTSPPDANVAPDSLFGVTTV